jgi:hypothetical protein
MEEARICRLLLEAGAIASSSIIAPLLRRSRIGTEDLAPEILRIDRRPQSELLHRRIFVAAALDRGDECEGRRSQVALRFGIGSHGEDEFGIRHRRPMHMPVCALLLSEKKPPEFCLPR